MPTATTATQANAFARVAKEHRDGCVLLSVANDRICKLNGVGALTWLILERAPSAVTVDQVVRELSAQFDVINAEGESLYEVTAEQLKTDTARFIRSLDNMGLLRVLSDAEGRELYRIKEGVSGTTSATVAALAERQVAVASSSVIDSQETPTRTVDSASATAAWNGAPELSLSSRIKPRKRETLTAFIGLFAFDLVLRFFGFQSLIRTVERWHIAQPHTVDLEICRRVRAMVDRAQVYYPKKAMCLQHSAVVTCLLRRRGIPAQMVLAAQDFPPKGHAWVEVEGEVVNDKPTVKDIYRTLRRL